MARTILGISAFYHDSAAALVRNGEIIAAAEEERFSRIKHDPGFPDKAINFCLEEAFIDGTELDAIIYYENPLFTFDRILQNALATGVNGKDQFIAATESILGEKLWVNDRVLGSIGTLGIEGKVLFAEHHMSHAASAFYPSPFESAAILVMDGVGEWATTSLGCGKEKHIELFSEINYPHSLGLLYSSFTQFCGFKVNSGEYKLMGLAPYGQPVYYDLIRQHLIDIRDDGSYRLNMSYFAYLDKMIMTNERFASLFNGPARLPESLITRREMNLAASIQKITEEIVLKTAKHLRNVTQEKYLVMAGGVALNCVVNSKLLASGLFERIWIQPAAGDSGGSLGAALLANHIYFDEPRTIQSGGNDKQKGSYLGPSYTSEEIRAFLNCKRLPYFHVPEQENRLKIIAQALSDGKIVGWFSGRMEFGPRALGARSILGDPRSIRTQSYMNMKIKYRESFRPFAPSVLYEKRNEYFDMDFDSPYMLFIAFLKDKRRIPMEVDSSCAGNDNMLHIVNLPRSDVPAITHVDYSARIQTVNVDNYQYYSLIKTFEELTGYGLLVNTSFNVRGEPIVCTPKDAYNCFMSTDMDLLVLEDILLWREAQPELSDQSVKREAYDLD